MDMSFEHMAVLRPELLTMFTRHKVRMALVLDRYRLVMSVCTRSFNE